MAGLWPAHSFTALPLVVCCGWGKALILAALVGLIADCGAIRGDLRGFWGFGLVLVLVEGERGCFGA